MILLLLRHAHAGDSAKWAGDDDLRPLSERGRGQARRLGRLLAAAGEAPDLLIASPRTRALETAELVAAEVGAPVIVDERLAGGLDAEVVDRIVRGGGGATRPCLVGHDPDFSSLLGELVGLDVIPMRKGALARIDFPGDLVTAGSGSLGYLLPPELLPER